MTCGSGPLPLVAVARGLGVALAAALLLSAAQWVPTVAVARHSARVGIPRWVNTYWSVHPASLADLLVPRLVEGFPMNESVRAAVFEGREPLLVSIYLGLPCAALAALGAVAGGPRGRRLALAFVFFLLAALGRYTSVYPLLLHVPGVALFRYPVKYLSAAALFWALLVAVGVQAWLGAWGARERRRAFVVAAGTGMLAVALLGLGEQVRRRPLTVAPLLWSAPGAAADDQPLADTIARLWTAAASALVAAALLAARARAGPRPWLTAALVTLVSADLVSAGAAVNPLAPPELMRHRPPLLQKLPPEQRVFVFPYPILWLNQQLSRGPAGWKPEWRWALGSIEQLQPPSGARWRVYGSFDGDFTGLAAPMTSAFGGWVQRGGPLALRLLQMGGVGYVVALPPPPIPGLAEVGVWPSVFREPIRLFQVSEPLPRAYAVDGVRVATEPASFDVLADPGFDPRSEVILPSGLASGPAAGFSSNVRVAWRRADAVGIEAELSRPGHLVLLDAYDAGWRATVDGQPAEVVRANVLFRAVAVSAGRHVVTFRYRPPAVVAGFVVSALTLAAGLVLVGSRRLNAPDGSYSIQAFRMNTPTPADRPGPPRTNQA